MYTIVLCFLLTTIVLWVWSMAIPAPLEPLADPNTTPNPSKAPWYFVGLQELLVYFDPWIAGVVLPTMIIIGLMAEIQSFEHLKNIFRRVKRMWSARN